MDIQQEIAEFQKNLEHSRLANQPHQVAQSQRVQSQRSTSSNKADLEFRDQINDRVSNHFFSQPEHGREAHHYFDSSLIRDNPQYQNSHNSDENLYRRDNREGMNMRLDSLMFQSFDQPKMPKGIRVNNPQENPMSRTQKMQPAFDHTLFGQSSNNLGREQRPSYSEASLNPQMVTHYPLQLQPEKSQGVPNQPQQQNQPFLAPLPGTFNNVFHQTNRASNRDRQNERMQEFSSLPRTMNQPSGFVNDRAPASPYKLSYESKYYQSGNDQDKAYLGNMGRSTGGYMPGTFVNSRVNYKDSHNERLQDLTPLAKTSATPVCTLDYAGSVGQNSKIITDSRDFREQDMNSRQSLADQRQAEWQRMSSNISQLGNNQQHLVINTLRPVDTRQAE